MDGIVSTPETAALLFQLFNKEISLDDPRFNELRQNVERFMETTPIGTFTEQRHQQQQQQQQDSESQLFIDPRVQCYDYFGGSYESDVMMSPPISSNGTTSSQQVQQQQQQQLSESTARHVLETPESESSTNNDIRVVYIKQEPNESNNDKDGPVMRVITCKKEIGSIKIKPEPTEYQYDVTVPMDRTTLKSEPTTSTSTTTTTTIPIVCTTLKPEPTTTTLLTSKPTTTTIPNGPMICTTFKPEPSTTSTNTTSTKTTLKRKLTTTTTTITTTTDKKPSIPKSLIPPEQCFEVEDFPTRVVPTLSEICKLQLSKRIAEMMEPNYESTPSDQMLLLKLLEKCEHKGLTTGSTTSTGSTTQQQQSTSLSTQIPSVPPLPTTGPYDATTTTGSPMVLPTNNPLITRTTKTQQHRLTTTTATTTTVGTTSGMSDSQSKRPVKQRMTYIDEFKIKVSNFALNSNVSKAVNKFNVPRSCVHRWVKENDMLEKRIRKKKEIQKRKEGGGRKQRRH